MLQTLQLPSPATNDGSVHLCWRQGKALSSCQDQPDAIARTVDQLASLMHRVMTAARRRSRLCKPKLDHKQKHIQFGTSGVARLTVSRVIRVGVISESEFLQCNSKQQCNKCDSPHSSVAVACFGCTSNAGESLTCASTVVCWQLPLASSWLGAKASCSQMRTIHEWGLPDQWV